MTVSQVPQAKRGERFVGNPDRLVGGSELRICFFGDSISFGQGVSLEQNWVAQNAVALQHLFPHHRINCFNPSLNGNTTRMALERMPQDVQAHRPHLTMVQFGLNDANFWVSDNGHPRVSILAYESNLREIVDRLRLSGAETIILNTNHVTDIDGRPEKKISPLAPLTYREHIFRYNECVRHVAESMDCRLLDVERHWLEMIAEKGDDHGHLLDDGVHLSVAGHQLYHKLTFAVLVQEVEATVSDVKGA